MADLATAGASWSWLDQEALLPIIQDLATNDFEVWRFLTSETNAHTAPRIESPISTKLQAVMVLRLLYGLDVGTDFQHFEKNATPPTSPAEMPQWRSWESIFSRSRHGLT